MLRHVGGAYSPGKQYGLLDGVKKKGGLGLSFREKLG